MNFGAALALLVGALVLAPIVAHLLRRRRTEVRDFPSARLVPVATPLARSRSRLEDRALFGVRALVVLALAVLGASPFVSCSRLDLGRRGGGSIALVLVIDDSMSMRAKLGRGTRLGRAREAALELMSSLHEGDAVAIVAAGAPARITLATTTDLAAARALAAAVKETDRGTDLDGALAIATSLARALPQPDRRVVVLSDLADGRSTAAPIAGEGDVAVWVPLAELRGRAPDCGVVRATARGGAVRAHVSCGAPEDATGRMVAIYAGATKLSERPLSPLLVQDVDVPIPESSLGASLVARLGGSDAIEADDAAPVVAASGALAVAVVADLSQSGVVTGGPSAVEQALAAIDETLPIRPLPTVPDHAEDLAPFSAVVLDDPPGMTPEARAAFRAWIERGGVAFALLGPRAGGAILGTAFDPFVPGAVRWTTTTPAGADPASVLALGATGEGMTTLAPKGRALLDARADAATTSLARWSDGQPLLFSRALGRGTAFVSTLPGSLDASDFPVRPAFLEVLSRVIEAGRARATGRRGVVGATWTFADAAPTKILGPGGPLALRDQGGVKSATPELAGAYAVEFRDAIEARVAEIEEREVDLRPRAAAKEATSEALGSQKAKIDASPYVAFVLLFAIFAEAALRVWTRMKEREASPV